MGDEGRKVCVLESNLERKISSSRARHKLSKLLDLLEPAAENNMLLYQQIYWLNAQFWAKLREKIATVNLVEQREVNVEMNEWELVQLWSTCAVHHRFSKAI